MNTPMDRSLKVTAELTRTGERERFQALCMPFEADLFRFVYWLCRDRTLTEDVVQETLLRAWRSFHSLGEEQAVRHWLLTIARRELARVFERKRIKTVDIDATVEDQHEAFSTHDRHEVDEMRRALLKLDLVHREPLVLQVLFGYSTEEIAEYLHISVAAVLTRLYRARHALRAQLVGTAGDAEDCAE